MQTQKLQFTFNGTGAAVYLCLGAVPLSAKLINIEAGTNSNFIEWNRNMVGSVTCYGGIYMTGSTGVYTKLTTVGIFPYEGGDLMTTANQTSTAYGEGIYLEKDLRNYQADTVFGPTSATINRWTLDTSGNRTGHFNLSGVASGCKIGVGSIVRVKEDASGLVKEAAITALTSTPTFTTADYVTLSRAIGSGTVTFIGGLYRMAPVPLGKVTAAGLYIADTSCNVNDETQSIEVEINVP